jgi:hypothetical protein
MRTIFGREPAVLIEMLVAVALGVITTLNLTEPVFAAANAVALAVGGVLTGLLVSAEKLLPALLGAIKAVFALVVVLGVNLDPSLETGIIMVVSAIGMAFIRQNVVAPVPANRDFRLTTD